MALKMKKVQRDKVFQHIVDELEQAIAGGKFKPGDKLPSEMKLTEVFSAGRSSVREGLRILEQKGLIDIKRGAGGGAIVREIDTAKATESFTLFLQTNQVRFEQMAEFRGIMEAGVTALAARRRTAEGVAHLRDILEKARETLDQTPVDWAGFYALDVDFHIEIGRIADNPVFVAVLSMLHRDILGQEARFSPADPDQLEQNYAEMVDICQAVADGDEEAAARIAGDHVAAFNSHMEDQREMFGRD